MADPLDDALDAIQTLLANTPAFQDFANVDNSTDALDHIFQGEIGTPVSSLALAAGVLTVSLKEPLILTAGQVITIDGAAIGEQGTTLNGTYTIADLGDTVRIPWTDSNGTIWRDPDGNPWTYDSGAVLSFTIEDVPGDDVDEFQPDGVVLLPCARPYALLIRGDSNTLKTKSIATGGLTIVSGEADILIEARVPSGYRNDAPNAIRAANSAFSTLLSGLAALSGVDDYILLNDITPGAAPEFIDTAEQNSNAGRFERWRGWMHVTWGLES